MLLFRSEEEIERWSAATGVPGGAIVPIRQLEELAGRWYGDRLDPDWRPRTIEMSQAILDGAGLTGDFWRLA
jgi:hypothetical protein